ncbi:Not1 N-terminal domain, CCR4-Not complex component-domain-containing protein [Lipomyces japonicus]|uniref:Not1 N-terminal domain, CCR4-Not complex component-domain-containing protein n=1 Tax=Lipomyces japonicus TaxID=56871 RepID=UPI0034CE817A
MAQRKLQQEIDRVFKRVTEGVAAFDSVYEKVIQSTNPSQKEKLEQDLKREIKKLQRLRDQIKTWMGSNDIKDKKSLSDQRKLIETQMERFKACEKEMKTKAYSKEGLTASLKLDPREKEKQEMANFITSMLDDLDRQVETAEAEVESLSATIKRGKKDSSKAERIGEVEERIERHKWHQGKLEVILRLLENGNLEADKVANIQEDIKYYVESNLDGDFAEDDEIYDGLNLEEEEEVYGMNENDHLSVQDNHSVHDEFEKEKDVPPVVVLTPVKKVDVARKTTTAKVSPVVATHPPATSHHVNVSTAQAPVSTSASTSTASTAIGSTNMKPAPVPARPAGEVLKYASAAAAAAAVTPGLSPLPPPPPSAAGTATPASTSTLGKSEKSVPASTSTKISASNVSSPANSHASPVISNAWSVTATSSSSPLTQKADVFAFRDLEHEINNIHDHGPNGIDREPTPELEPPSSSDEATTARSEDLTFHAPVGLEDLVSSFDSAKARIENPIGVTSEITGLLETAAKYCPDSSDADKPRYYRPITPFPTSAHFPQEPLPIFDDPMLYEKVDIDTLFYVFYYRQGTYLQYLASKELKKQSWRFHKKFLTWFQRHEEPKIITDDFEQGTYRYFDFEGTWLQRRKQNFEFQYQYLEDEI